MRKVLIITGLTGSGKSSLAVQIAKKYNGEIISADSVQIYKGLDIGSAKESKDTMSKISHHLIDIKDFNETYNVGEFVEDCKKYNEALNKVQIDLQLLGIGGNGHIGFNEPGTPFDQETFIVELTEKTRQDNKRFFNSLEEVKNWVDNGAKIVDNQRFISENLEEILNNIEEEHDVEVIQVVTNVVDSFNSEIKLEDFIAITRER